MTLSLSTTALLAGTAIFLVFLLYRAALPKPIPGIPYTPAAARNIFGDVPAALQYRAKTRELVAFLAEKCEELNSPVAQAFMRPFSGPWVLVWDGHEAMDIMTRRTKEFDRSNFFNEMFGTVLPNSSAVMPTNDHWRHNRRLVSDTMTPTFLNAITGPVIYKNTLHFLELWQQKLRLAKGHVIDITEDMKMVTVDVIWAAAFGGDLDSCKSTGDFYRKLNSCELPQSQDTVAVLPSAPIPSAYEALRDVVSSTEIPLNNPLGSTAHWLALTFFPKLRRAAATRKRYVNENIKASDRVFGVKGSGGQDVKSAADLVIQRETALAQKEGRKPEYDSADVRDELGTFLQAGYETSSTTMQWGIKYLTKHQHVQDKLRSTLKEAHRDAAGRGEAPSAEAIAKTSVPYLDAFIEETLRYSCIVPVINRRPVKDTQILGHFIPKGTEVFLMISGPGFTSPALNIDESKRSPTSREAKDQYSKYEAPDLNQFRPERWLVTDGKGETHFDGNAAPNQAFGAGLRGCFGKRLAYLEMRIIFTLMIWNFELQPIPEALMDFKAQDVFTHQPQNVRVILSRAQ